MTFSEWFFHWMKYYGVPNMPVVGEFDCGHTHPCMPLVIGGYYHLNVKENNINIEYACSEKGGK